MTPDKFEENCIIHDHEADCMRRFTPGAVLRRAQQVSTDHCDTLGLTAQVYEQTHTAFLLAKLSVQWHRQLHTGDEVHAVTHPSAPQRATYYRLTEFYHARTGALACTIDTRWVLVDTNTKRILRKAPDALPIPFTLPPRQETKLELLKADTAPVGQVTAGFSRCDVNGHLNNTQYADILCDYVPAGQMKKRDIRRLVLAYHREVPMGHSFVLNRGEVENGYYFLGESDGVKHFEANVLWE